MELNTAESIREAVICRWPDVNDDEFSIEHSGFAHDHPMIPICVVLISSIVLGTTDPIKLAKFTKYSEHFVSAIATNMENADLWKDDKYDCSTWFSGNPVPQEKPEVSAFWRHVMIADGWEHTDKNVIGGPSAIFWAEMRAQAKARGIFMTLAEWEARCLKG